MSRVTVADDIFDMQKHPDSASSKAEFELEGWEIEPQFLVHSKNLDGAGLALQSAARRFMLVTYDRTEVDSVESAAMQDVYTPNGVSDVRIYDGGVMVRVNTKGELSEPMGAAMLHILVSELDGRGVDAHITGVVGFHEGEKWVGPNEDRPTGTT